MNTPRAFYFFFLNKDVKQVRKELPQSEGIALRFELRKEGFVNAAPLDGVDAAAVERLRDVEEGDLVIEKEHAVFELLGGAHAAWPVYKREFGAVLEPEASAREALCGFVECPVHVVIHGRREKLARSACPRRNPPESEYGRTVVYDDKHSRAVRKELGIERAAGLREGIELFGKSVDVGGVERR